MTDKPDLDELARLQKDCGIPHLPTPLTYDLRRAISGEGPRAYDWADKPHRLVYDACRKIEAMDREVEALRGEVARLRDQAKLGLTYLDKADNPNSERNYAAGVAAIERAADAIERGEV